jgi:repressor LexA
MRSKSADPVEGMTPRQLQVLKHIAAFHDKQCYSPTIAELANEMGLSRSTVFEHIGELQRKGLLSTSPGRARSLMTTSKGQRLLKQLAVLEAEPERHEDPGVPLVGRVAAGLPLEAVQNEDHLSMGSCFGMGGDLFALEVSGDSMIDEDIRSGDYVICRRSNVASDGELVVVLVDEEEATLKRFYKEADQVRLQAANAAYEPIYTNNCRIEAIVVGLVRKL